MTECGFHYPLSLRKHKNAIHSLWELSIEVTFTQNSKYECPLQWCNLSSIEQKTEHQFGRKAYKTILIINKLFFLTCIKGPHFYHGSFLCPNTEHDF